jgi:hypothetical protein
MLNLPGLAFAAVMNSGTVRGATAGASCALGHQRRIEVQVLDR